MQGPTPVVVVVELVVVDVVGLVVPPLVVVGLVVPPLVVVGAVVQGIQLPQLTQVPMVYVPVMVVGIRVIVPLKLCRLMLPGSDGSWVILMDQVGFPKHPASSVPPVEKGISVIATDRLPVLEDTQVVPLDPPQGHALQPEQGAPAWLVAAHNVERMTTPHSTSNLRPPNVRTSVRAVERSDEDIPLLIHSPWDCDTLPMIA